MKKILIPAICLLLAACESGSGDKPEVNPSDTTAVPGKPAPPELYTSGPVEIDSSENVMYPLPHITEEKEDDSGSYSSSGDARSVTFWNIAFYNTNTRKYHLLDNNKRMIINSYNTDYTKSAYSSQSGHAPYDKSGAVQQGSFIFYTIISEDQNKDGKLDDKDPDYLYISDKEGNNFRQISPRGTNVENWEMIKKTGMILMETRRDSTYKGKDVDVAAIQYLYDLKKGGVPERVFSPEFSGMVDKLYKKQWPIKKKQ